MAQPRSAQRDPDCTRCKIGARAAHMARIEHSRKTSVEIGCPSDDTTKFYVQNESNTQRVFRF